MGPAWISSREAAGEVLVAAAIMDFATKQPLNSVFDY
jgi:hypothetical protein